LSATKQIAQSSRNGMALHRLSLLSSRFSVQWEKIAMFMSWILARIRRELEYRRALRMLSRLTDHQLDDIGLDRMQLTVADWAMDSQK
jgi:uncharacterized protein YjiS (DUF1127 family)